MLKRDNETSTSTVDDSSSSFMGVTDVTNVTKNRCVSNNDNEKLDVHYPATEVDKPNPPEGEPLESVV